MSRSMSPSVLVVASLAACAAPLTALPPPPTGLEAIAIATPQNTTGGDLTVDEDGFMAGLLDDRTTVTVPALLEHDLRVALDERDFRIATKGAHRIAEDLSEGWTVAPSPERAATR